MVTGLSAGTFPLELVPKFLQHFNSILPMTYTVQAFKVVISTGDYSLMWHNVIILLGFIVLFSVLSLAYFAVAFKKQYGSGMDQHTVEAKLIKRHVAFAMCRFFRYWS